MIHPEDYKLDEESNIHYVTMSMIREAHTHKEASAFAEWINGQTMMVASNGDMAIYSWDYERWIDQGKQTEQGIDWD